MKEIKQFVEMMEAYLGDPKLGAVRMIQLIFDSPEYRALNALSKKTNFPDKEKRFEVTNEFAQKVLKIYHGFKSDISESHSLVKDMKRALKAAFALLPNHNEDKLEKVEDGWIEWDYLCGQEPDCPDETLVEVKLKNGKIVGPFSCNFFNWGATKKVGREIVAYRIVSEPEELKEYKCKYCKDLPFLNYKGETAWCPRCDRKLFYTKEIKIRLKNGETQTQEQLEPTTLIKWLLDTGDNIDLYTPSEIISLISEYLEKYK